MNDHLSECLFLAKLNIIMWGCKKTKQKKPKLNKYLVIGHLASVSSDSSRQTGKLVLVFKTSEIRVIKSVWVF